VLLCDADLGESAGTLVVLVEAVEAGNWDLAVARPRTAEGEGLASRRSRSPFAHRVTGRTPGGFLHRASQLRDMRRAARPRAR
jgi:hypothetical protein